MKYFIHYLLIFIFFSFFSYLHAQDSKTGVFTEMVSYGEKEGLIHFYVPEDYNPNQSYPLIMGMSPGGGPGIGMLFMIHSFAVQRKIILACPDPTVGTLQLLDTVLAYTTRKFNIDEKNVICTGYSAGAAATVPYTENRPKTIKGVIGIATSIFMQNFLLCNNRAFAFIAGKLDAAWGSSLSLAGEIIKAGGVALVIAKDSIGHFGAYYGSPEFLEDFKTCYDFIQAYKPLNKVNLVSPADSAQNLPDPIILTWNKKPQADKYQVRLHWATYILKTEETKDTNHIFDSLMSNSEYSWTARCITGSDTGAWADIRYFKTILKVPAKPPLLIFPGNGVTNVNPRNYLRWDSSPESEYFHYQVIDENSQTMFLEDSAFTSVMVAHTEKPFVHKSKYKWRVRGGNSIGWGPWSDYFTFTCIDPTASVDDKLNNDLFHSAIYPNPAYGIVNFNFDIPEAGKISIRFYDLKGRQTNKVFEQEMDAGKHNIQFNFQNMVNSTYFYELIFNKKAEYGIFELSK